MVISFIKDYEVHFNLIQLYYSHQNNINLMSPSHSTRVVHYPGFISSTNIRENKFIMGRAGIVKQKIMIIKIRRKYFCVGISKVGHESNNFPPQDTKVAEEERESNLVQIIAHFLSCPIYTSCYNIYPVITETVGDHLKNKSR